MSDSLPRAYFLLTCFAEFYEAVAEIKQAIREDRLPLMLGSDERPAPTGASEIAAMLSARLSSRLETQLNSVARAQPLGVVRAHRIAVYVMAALADEIFVLEMEWSGRDAWLNTLLEYRLFKTRFAGQKVFDLIQQLLDLPDHDGVHADLAAVYLMALQLGFKGEHRGAQGTAVLQQLRARLFALLSKGPEGSKLAFPQAYQFIDTDSQPVRLAPLSPWYAGGGIMLALYLVVSTVDWLHLIQPVLDAMPGK